MNVKDPKNTRDIEWTKHAIGKMRMYGISEQKVKQIIRSPKRTEEGVAPETVAVMSPFGSPTKDGRLPYRGEIWVMIKVRNSKSEYRNSKQIISVWRYPGKSPERGPIPIPEEIQKEIFI